MQFIQGKGVSKGVAAGPLYFFRRRSGQTERRKIDDIDAELVRFGKARETAIEQLKDLYNEALADIGKEDAALFIAHQMILEDRGFVGGMEELIREGVNAEAAVDEVALQFMTLLQSVEDEYTQERAADVRDVADRVIGILNEAEAIRIDSQIPVIVAADDLSPSETVQLDKTRILGFITQNGSPTSHTAILARTMGIPAIVGAGEKLRTELSGEYTMIDGDTGEVFIDPNEIVREGLLEKQERTSAEKERLEYMRGLPDRTIDGKEVMVYCNISCVEDLDAVLENDGGGIGLFRSEFLYLKSDECPSEEEQFQAYRAVAERMNGLPVIIRTLDIGADKQADYFESEPEDNPAMGLRAVRYCLTRPELFRTQLRAIYRASAYGEISIMFPMIASVWEIREVKLICQAVRTELAKEQIPFDERVKLGIMIETPASVMISDQLAKEVDFFSVGTNDLTQYTLAADRQNSRLDRFVDPHHPAVLRMIRMAADSAHREGIWIGICGELGADTSLTETFLAMGIDELSIAPAEVFPVRRVIRSIDTRVNRDVILERL